jgi:hypothetical protein
MQTFQAASGDAEQQAGALTRIMQESPAATADMAVLFSEL